jgi:hypothetical protein
VNDPFVCQAWAKQHKAEGQVRKKNLFPNINEVQAVSNKIRRSLLEFTIGQVLLTNDF